MIKTIALDDEPLALELIENYCQRMAFLQYEKGFTKSSQAMQYIEKNPINLLFLDINMPAISGIDFYKSLPYKPMLIFTTSYSEYALESYEMETVDYLLKPFSFARFEKAVVKARDIYNLVQNATVNDQSKFLLLKADCGVIKILLNDIFFIEGLDNYLKIHIQNKPPVLIRLTLKAMMDMLNENEFIRVHRSYILPLNKINAIKKKIITVGNKAIPIGKNYENNLRALFEKKK